jgi:hypothetical protein
MEPYTHATYAFHPQRHESLHDFFDQAARRIAGKQSGWLAHKELQKSERPEEPTSDLSVKRSVIDAQANERIERQRETRTTTV